jgi:hypothetical protein
LSPIVAKDSLSDVEQLTNICTEAIATSLKPTIRKMLLERMLKNGTDDQTVGFLQTPNLDTMSNKELLELYVKLKKKEMKDEWKGHPVQFPNFPIFVIQTGKEGKTGNNVEKPIVTIVTSSNWTRN